MTSRHVAALTWSCVIALITPFQSEAQQETAPQRATAGMTETAPIACWRRTSSGAVRVGEHFTLVLTCAVVETEATTVVADESRLDPAVLQMPPFDVIGGTRAADLQTAVRRFFQYEYLLRVINEDVIGEDVSLPELTMTYRVQSRATQEAAAIETRDREYVLPPLAIRVLSLVPASATDIRDRPSRGFDEIGTRRVRANAFTLFAVVLFALGGAMLLFALVRVRPWRGQVAGASPRVTNAVILRGVDKELAAITATRHDAGCSTAPVARALAALRIAAGYAAGRRVAQTTFKPGGALAPGQLVVRHGLMGRRAVVVSGSATPDSIIDAAQRGNLSEARVALLGSLQAVMEQMSKAAYGRNGALQSSELGGALSEGQFAVRQLVEETGWLARVLQAAKRRVARLRQRLWVR